MTKNLINTKCKETNWEECCSCEFFDFCESKELNRQGIITVANSDLKKAFQQIKRRLLNFSFKKVKLSARNNRRQQMDLEEKLYNEQREIKLKEWAMHSKPEEFYLDDSKVVGVRRLKND